MTPLKSPAANISIFAAGVVAIPLLARIVKAPWRSLISSPRGLDARHLGICLVGATLLEAPTAFHVADNVLFGIVNTVMANGEPYAIDQSTDPGDASPLILGAVNIAMVVLDWLHERRSRDVGAG
ncbi:hypothetical protein [Micromonospora zamorensis]|uniref:hypothetical protein n=1 Tax=Micromonospora zamorensis TaxID=709883 RepID=UPI003CEC9DAA